MTGDLSQWKAAADTFAAALPIVDEALSEQNVPISERKSKAFQILCDTLIEISDWEAFLVSDAHGRFLVIVEQWYRERYGDAAMRSHGGERVATTVVVHRTPFLLEVPKNFSIADSEPGHTWIGFPASVQKEEDPLDWIANQQVVEALDPAAKVRLREEIMPTANAARSIGFDLRALLHDSDRDIADLAGAVGTDMQASARHLCNHSQAGLLASGWDISQATEKSLKIMIRRKGEVPAFTHDLSKLADAAERLGAAAIDRSKLATIPSSASATDMRYGGSVTLADALKAYNSGIEIIRQLLFEATPDVGYNIREARFKIKRPPWFDFDAEGFVKALRQR